MHPTLRYSSLTSRTLVPIAVGVTLIVALASAVSYYLMYRDIQQRASDQLKLHVVERSRTEQQVFLFARDSQAAIRRAVLNGYDGYMVESTATRFDQLFMRYPDGAIRSRADTIQGQDAVTGWIHKDTAVNDELRRRMLLFHDILQQFKTTSLLRFADIYFTSPEQINIGTDPPGVALWAMTVAADFDQNAEDWVNFADKKKNPHRETRWSAVFLDPVWKKLLVTIATPIDRHGRHIGTIHNDLLLETLLDNLLRPGMPGTKHSVFQSDGRIIAHTDKVAQLRAQQGEYFIQSSQDAALTALLAVARSATSWPASGYDRSADQYYAISRLEGPNWYFASTIEGDYMRAQAFSAAQWVLWSGLSSLALLLLVLALILQRRIAKPLGELTTAAERVAVGEPQGALTAHRRDELGRLAGVFNGMMRKIDERDTALRAEKHELEATLLDARRAHEEIRRQRETLQQREKLAAMGSLLAGVAHEINNPLSVVVGRTAMLEETAEPQTRAAVRKIREAAERCARIVKTFLAMARQHAPERTQVQVNAVIEAALDVLDYSLQASGVQVVQNLAADLPELFADSDQLHQVFMNLIVNAQQAMADHDGERILTIITRHDKINSAIQAAVADSGPGIPGEIRCRIFEPYFTTKPIGAGTGVGLAVSLGIIEAHGGSIVAQSAEHGGATFLINLPIGAAPPTASPSVPIAGRTSQAGPLAG